MLLAFDERLGVEPGQLAQLAQKQGGRFKPDRGLQIGTLQRFAQIAAEFAIQADVDLREGELLDVGEMTSERKGHTDLGANAFDQAPDFGQIGRAVEGAVHWADYVHHRLLAGQRWLGERHALRPELGP